MTDVELLAELSTAPDDNPVDTLDPIEIAIEVHASDAQSVLRALGGTT